MSSSHRLTLKQTDAQDRAQRVAQSRNELTNRIRKQKKHEHLARKRQYAAAPPHGETPGYSGAQVAHVHALIKDFVTTPTLEPLRKLHDALQVTSLEATEDNWLVILAADDVTTASSLIGCMGDVASNPEGLPLVLNILVRLTSISYAPPGGSSSTFYYGNAPHSWSSLVSNCEAWLSQLVQLAPQMESASVVLGNLVGEANTESFVRLRQAGLIRALLSAIHQPAAAWALTNAIQHDTVEYASVYCNDQALSAALLEQLLKEKPVATQAAWMLTALTTREAEVVQYLMKHPTFATTMIDCMKSPVCKDQLAPLVQALGNIATSSTSDGGPPFSTNMITALPTLTPMLGQLLQIPTNREVVQQAAWLASCLLQNAGIPDHPATTIAAPTLVPLLFQELRENTPHSFQNQSELSQALWSAICVPPGAESNTIFDRVLLPLPAWKSVRSALFTLVKLAGSMDADACMSAISVIKVLLERSEDHERIRVLLIEADLTSVLEKVCDSADEEIGEIAANLLDTFFYTGEEEETYMDNEAGIQEPDDTFAFSPGTERSSSESGMSRGTGVGRGSSATIPAWMNHATNGMNAI